MEIYGGLELKHTNLLNIFLKKELKKMPREKPNYRDMLQILLEKYPLLLSKKQTAEALGISRTHLDKIISKGHLKFQDGKIPIGSIASYLCG